MLSNEQINWNVRGSIAVALGSLGERSVAPVLVSMLSNEQINSGVHQSIAGVLGLLGERSVAPALVSMLSNEQIDTGVHQSIAGALGSLGERSVAPALVSMLSNEQINWNVRWSIAGALGSLVGDEKDIQKLVALLPSSDIADRIHSSLWTLSLRMGVRILVVDNAGGQQLKVVKWSIPSVEDES
jgi:HEAT repeat protein